ncbi:MAG: cyclophilin-like fold protein [Chloroflexota bacterium]|nr:cyclophilin-like fold protein [Chloroflexota bacterium]
MAQEIRIIAGGLEVEATLNGSVTARAVAAALPITASTNTWGDEIYFGIPVDASLEDGREVVDLGDLGYWPPGRAFCIFFGPTPASRGEEIRPASAVTIIGRVTGDPVVFKQVSSGAQVTIELSE